MGLFVLVPELVATVNGPVVAVGGTVAWIWVRVVAAAVLSVTPLNFTVTGLAKLPPLMSMVLPRAPLSGTRLLT